MTHKNTWICDRCGKEDLDVMFPIELKGFTPVKGKSWKYYMDRNHLCDDCYVLFREWLGK